MPPLSIGVVGCGAVGRAILRAADEGALNVEVAGAASRSESPAREFLSTLREPPPYLSVGELIEQADLIVEAAGASAASGLVDAAFAAGKGAMVISVGALVAHPELLDKARETGCRLLMPSGAIIGLDGVKAASEGRVDRVVMESRKGPAALDGAPHIVQSGLDLWALEEESVVFSGSAREACAAFPANLNVSAAVSFAGIGPDRTEVRMIAVPGLKRNCHDVEVEGEFGLMRLHLENIPGENPKTGRLTAMSIIRALRQETDPVRLGT